MAERTFILTVPKALADTIKGLDTDTGVFMRWCLKLGLIFHELLREPGTKVIIRRGRVEQELVLGENVSLKKETK